MCAHPSQSCPEVSQSGNLGMETKEAQGGRVPRVEGGRVSLGAGAGLHQHREPLTSSWKSVKRQLKLGNSGKQPFGCVSD